MIPLCAGDCRRHNLVYRKRNNCRYHMAEWSSSSLGFWIACLWMEAGDSVFLGHLEYWSKLGQHWGICSSPGYPWDESHLEAWFISRECEIGQIQRRWYPNTILTRNWPGTCHLHEEGAGQMSLPHLLDCHEPSYGFLPSDSLFLVL